MNALCQKSALRMVRRNFVASAITGSDDFLESFGNDSKNLIEKTKKSSGFTLPKFDLFKLDKHIRNGRYYFRTEMYEKPKIYYSKCRQLKSGYEIKLSAYTLARLPMTSLALEEEKNFIDLFLEPWWTVMVDRFRELPVRDLILVLTALRAMNESSGNLLETLRSHNLFLLVDYIFDSCLSEVYPKRMDTILSCLVGLFKNASVDEKINFKNKLASIVPVYISAITKEEISYSREINLYIERILYHLVELGVENPSRNCTQEILSLYGQKLSTPTLVANNVNERLEDFADLHGFASILLFWNVDPIWFSSSFWPRWFERTAPSLFYADGLTMVMMVRNFISVAVRFNREDELNQLKSLLIDKLRKNKQYASDDYFQPLTNEIKSKLNRISSSNKTDPANPAVDFLSSVLDELEKNNK